MKQFFVLVGKNCFMHRALPHSLGELAHFCIIFLRGKSFTLIQLVKQLRFAHFVASNWKNSFSSLGTFNFCFWRAAWGGFGDDDQSSNFFLPASTADLDWQGWCVGLFVAWKSRFLLASSKVKSFRLWISTSFDGNFWDSNAFRSHIGFDVKTWLSAHFAVIQVLISSCDETFS